MAKQHGHELNPKPKISTRWNETRNGCLTSTDACAQANEREWGQHRWRLRQHDLFDVWWNGKSSRARDSMARQEFQRSQGCRSPYCIGYFYRHWKSWERIVDIVVELARCSDAESLYLSWERWIRRSVKQRMAQWTPRQGNLVEKGTYRAIVWRQNKAITWESCSKDHEERMGNEWLEWLEIIANLYPVGGKERERERNERTNDIVSRRECS